MKGAHTCQLRIEILPLQGVLQGEDHPCHDCDHTVTVTVLIAALTWSTISCGIDSSL